MSMENGRHSSCAWLLSMQIFLDPPVKPAAEEAMQHSIGSNANGSQQACNTDRSLQPSEQQVDAFTLNVCNSHPEQGERCQQSSSTFKLVQAGCRSTRRYMVWGSSLGWLVFYGCIAFGLDSYGVALLPCLVQHARTVHAECGNLSGL